MPTTIYLTQAQAGIWEVPEGIGLIDVTVEGQGCQGGASDPVGETGGGGGGQGGTGQGVGLGVMPGELAQLIFDPTGNYVMFLKGGAAVWANGGAPASGHLGGGGGDGYSVGFGSNTGYNGANGQNAQANGHGGNGGGSTNNHGTPTTPAAPGFNNGGGGGQGFNGPGNPGTGGGGRITITLYPFDVV